MSDIFGQPDNPLDRTDREGGRRGQARALARDALKAEAAGDDAEADRLFAEAEFTDPEAVSDVLQEPASAPKPAAPPGPQSDAEIAAMSRTVEPHREAPSRAGVLGSGSGADGQGL